MNTQKKIKSTAIRGAFLLQFSLKVYQLFMVVVCVIFVQFIVSILRFNLLCLFVLTDYSAVLLLAFSTSILPFSEASILSKTLPA